MYSDKNFGLPKDLISTVKKVMEENKNNQSLEEGKADLYKVFQSSGATAPKTPLEKGVEAVKGAASAVGSAISDSKLGKAVSSVWYQNPGICGGQPLRRYANRAFLYVGRVP